MGPVIRRLPIAILFAASIVAQGQDQGAWTAHFSHDNSVDLTLQNGEDKQQGFTRHSFTVPANRLRNRDFAPGATSFNSHFALKNDAGTINFSGAIRGETGTGTYVFSADPQFCKNMEQLGFSVAAEQQLFYVIYNVTISYARSMRDATGVNEAGRLLKMARLHVDAAFADKLSKAIGEKLEAEEVIEAARHGVSPEYVAAVHKLLPNAEFDDIARLRRRDVSLQFITSAQKCHTGVTAEQIEILKKKYGSPCASIK